MILATVTERSDTPLGTGQADRPLATEIIVEAGAWPPLDSLEALTAKAVAATFAELALKPEPETELNFVFSDDSHVRELNARWRKKDRPTNVLSFPAMPLPKDGSLPPLLGDIVLAFETVSAEAQTEGKPFEHHLGHLLVHGLLHLLGYDHEEAAAAEAMESAERRVLEKLAIPDPYT